MGKQKGNTLTIHYKSRSKHPQYPSRQSFDDKYVPWSTQFPEYNPIEYTDPLVVQFDRTVKQGGWADPPLPNRKLIETRKSYCGKILFNKLNRPLNPIGRTGMSGRGLLGNWGPNHAADPLVTRINPTTNLLEIIVVKRVDTGEWAIPGGMVDAGESVSRTLKREFGEEALASLDMTPEEAKQLKFLLDDLFQNGHMIYEGYVDDPRNTDNSWMETRAVLFHCSHSLAEKIKLKAGDDAADVRWLPLENNKEVDNLYASHKDFVLQAAAHLKSAPSSESKRSLFSCLSPRSGKM